MHVAENVGRYFDQWLLLQVSFKPKLVPHIIHIKKSKSGVTFSKKKCLSLLAINFMTMGFQIKAVYLNEHNYSVVLVSQ